MHGRKGTSVSNGQPTAQATARQSGQDCKTKAPGMVPQRSVVCKDWRQMRPVGVKNVGKVGSKIGVLRRVRDKMVDRSEDAEQGQKANGEGTRRDFSKKRADSTECANVVFPLAAGLNARDRRVRGGRRVCAVRRAIFGDPLQRIE
jgi:hypothetical protein